MNDLAKQIEQLELDAARAQVLARALILLAEYAEVDVDGEGNTQYPPCPECGWRDHEHRGDCSISGALEIAREVISG